MIYLKIILCYFQIGILSFGGGYASMPLINQMVVADRLWLTQAEFLDMVTVCQTVPGAFALNSASFVGYKLGGVLGAFLAAFSCLLPSFLFILLLAFLYRKYKNLSLINGALAGLRPAAAGLIAAAGLSLLFQSVFGTSDLFAALRPDYIATALAAASFIALRLKKINPALMILSAGAVGGAAYYISDIILK